jgi:hypothetical protein
MVTQTVRKSLPLVFKMGEGREGVGGAIAAGGGYECHWEEFN